MPIAIDKPSKYFNTILVSGDGTTSKSFTGAGFQPDLVWGKARDSAYNHFWYDSVRGAGAEKELRSSSTSAEGASDNETYGYVSSFDSDGFSVTGGTNSSYFNQSSKLFVNWLWKANGAGVSNTSGTISSTVSANTTSGFSVGTYTGNSTTDATIGHGLGVAPNMVIVKNRSGADNWQVYWNDGTERSGFLSLTNAFSTPASTSIWGNNNPTSSVFYVGNDTATNTSNNYVFYAFTSIKGFSKFGSYVGNGSNDGNFIYCGFKPSWILIRNATEVKNWYIYDVTRDTVQPLDLYLSPNLSDAEASFSAFNTIDALSNGFKLRGGSSGTGSETNGSGQTHIYMAFASNPFVSSKGIACTAR